MIHMFDLNAHLTAVRRWVKAAGGTLALDVNTYRATVSIGSKSTTLIPKFSFRASHGLAYTNSLTEETAMGFVGWLPYTVKRWPISSDKVVFKRYCEDQGLRVTPSWRPPETPQSKNFIVKRRNGSFGQNLFGPFRHDQTEAVPTLLDTDYCEAFVLGKTCKIWFWNDRPVAMEALEFPCLIGDGHRSLNALAKERRGNYDKSHSLEQSEAMLAWQGVSQETIVPEGTRVYLDFRFVTPFDPLVWGDRDSLAKQSEALQEHLRNIGRVLWFGIPEDTRHNTVFTLDAILDEEDRLWLLEMNSNPMVHQNTYGAMLDSIFERRNTPLSPGSRSTTT